MQKTIWTIPVSFYGKYSVIIFGKYYFYDVSKQSAFVTKARKTHISTIVISVVIV